jgi:hypothetical protein
MCGLLDVFPVAMARSRRLCPVADSTHPWGRTGGHGGGSHARIAPVPVPVPRRSCPCAGGCGCDGPWVGSAMGGTPFVAAPVKVPGWLTAPRPVPRPWRGRPRRAYPFSGHGAGPSGAGTPSTIHAEVPPVPWPAHIAHTVAPPADVPHAIGSSNHRPARIPQSPPRVEPDG